MNVIRPVLEIVGAATMVYFAVRVAATVKDIFQRWRRSRSGDPTAWDVEQ